MKNQMSKMERCRHAKVDMKAMSITCSLCNCNATEEKCEKCESFNSRFIEYPITVAKIDQAMWDVNDTLYRDKVGSLVLVRPTDPEYKGKTFVGIHLGELPAGPHISYNNASQTLNVFGNPNPAFFIPEIKKILFGYESWWMVPNKDELDAQITDEMIEAQPYMKMLKEMMRTK